MILSRADGLLPCAVMHGKPCTHPLCHVPYPMRQCRMLEPSRMERRASHALLLVHVVWHCRKYLQTMRQEGTTCSARPSYYWRRSPPWQYRAFQHPRQSRRSSQNPPPPQHQLLLPRRPSHLLHRPRFRCPPPLPLPGRLLHRQPRLLRHRHRSPPRLLRGSPSSWTSHPSLRARRRGTASLGDVCPTRGRLKTTAAI